MSRICQITGKGSLKGNRVSHSNNKTLRKTHANLVTKKIFEKKTESWVKRKLTNRALRTNTKKRLYETLKSLKKQKKNHY